jgi:hypothetical protein
MEYGINKRDAAGLFLLEKNLKKWYKVSIKNDAYEGFFDTRDTAEYHVFKQELAQAGVFASIVFE